MLLVWPCVCLSADGSWKGFTVYILTVRIYGYSVHTKVFVHKPWLAPQMGPSLDLSSLFIDLKTSVSTKYFDCSKFNLLIPKLKYGYEGKLTPWFSQSSSSKKYFTVMFLLLHNTENFIQLLTKIKITCTSATIFRRSICTIENFWWTQPIQRFISTGVLL